MNTSQIISPGPPDMMIERGLFLIDWKSPRGYGHTFGQQPLDDVIILLLIQTGCGLTFCFSEGLTQIDRSVLREYLKENPFNFLSLLFRFSLFIS